MFSFLQKTNTPAKLVRVKITSDTIAKAWGESHARGYSVGEALDVTPADAASLVEAERAEVIGDVTLDGTLVEKPKGLLARLAPPPPVYTKRPMPAGMADVFRGVWELQEELNRLRAEYAAAHAEVNGAGLSAAVVGEDNISAASRRILGKRDKAGAALRAFDSERLERAIFAAGNDTLAAIRDANGLAEQIAELAFELFSLRASGLGLTESQLRRAFHGSALRVKYCRPAEYEGSTIFVSGIVVLDEGIEQMSYRFSRAKTAKAELLALLAEVRAELEQARAVLAPKPIRRAA